MTSLTLGGVALVEITSCNSVASNPLFLWKQPISTLELKKQTQLSLPTSSLPQVTSSDFKSLMQYQSLGGPSWSQILVGGTFPRTHATWLKSQVGCVLGEVCLASGTQAVWPTPPTHLKASMSDGWASKARTHTSAGCACALEGVKKLNHGRMNKGILVSVYWLYWEWQWHFSLWWYINHHEGHIKRKANVATLTSFCPKKWDAASQSEILGRKEIARSWHRAKQSGSQSFLIKVRRHW